MLLFSEMVSLLTLSFLLTSLSTKTPTRRPITSLRDYRGVETSPRTPRRRIGRPSSCGPVTQVDNTIYVLVQIWSLAQTTPDPSTWGTKWDSDSRPRNEANLSSFDFRPDGGPLLHSAEFACPPPSQSLETFEDSRVGRDGEDDDDGCT
ncbi:hypothetical protein V8E53_000747 [Lactarius tabidus]